MPCPRENEVILYLTEFGLTESERKGFQAHLAGCEKCQRRVEQHRQFIAQSLQENDEVCRQIQDHLVEYLLSKVKQVAGVRIKSHLNECPRCLLVYQDLQRSLSEEEWAEMRQPLQRGLRIQFLFGEVPATIAELKEKFLREGATLVNLFIRKLIIEPAFLGEPEWGTKAVRHHGGNLVIYLRVPGQTTRLLTSDNRILEEQTSDADGFVRFGDYEAGNYRIQVEGTEIVEAKHEKPK